MEPEWFVNSTSCTKGTKLFEPFDLQAYRVMQEAYTKLSNADKGLYKGKEDYIVKHGGPELLPLHKSFMRLADEIDARLKNLVLPEPLPIDLLIQGDAVLDLLASLEDENYIKEIYRKKKHNVTSGLNTTEAVYLMDCIKQGRSLLVAGSRADIIAKPLIDFYAACAYAYAIIVINSPLHKSITSLKGSHGHTYNHTKGTVEFGGEIPSGTFLDFLCALPVAQVCNDGISFKYSLLPSIDFIQNNSIQFSLLSLMSMVPELSEYYTQLDSAHRLVHRLSIDTGMLNSKVTYNFYIGDGIHRPEKMRIERDFKTKTIQESMGSYQLSISAEEIESIMPSIYRDLRGQLWYIESPIDGVVLPEICLHFLIISALCNIMRYSPHEWSNTLSNKVSSQYSLLVKKYLRLFELKYPMLVSELITNFAPSIIER